jgi:hypothetical protein
MAFGKPNAHSKLQVCGHPRIPKAGIHFLLLHFSGVTPGVQKKDGLRRPNFL